MRAPQLTHVIFNRFEPKAMPILIFFFVLVPLASSMILLAHLPLMIALPVAFTTYFSALLTSIGLYRLSPFHPLSRYPGPIKLKLSSLFVYHMAIKGDRHKYIQRLHEEYQSDVLRIGPNELIFREASAIAPMMGTDGLAKGPGYDGRSLFRVHRNLISWTDPVQHFKRRKAWTRGTNTVALKDYEPVIAARASQLVDLLLRRSGGTVNLSECICYFAFDFMGDMAFGGGYEFMQEGDVRGTLHAMEGSIKVGMLMESIPWFSYHMHLIPSIATRFRNFSAVGKARATQRIQKGALVKDLFHYLNNDDGAEPVNPTLEVVSAEGALVILAGSHTTSGVLSSVMYLLAKYPEVYKKLQQEVDKFYPPGEDALDNKYYVEMRYLEAVINETLRLYAIQPSGSQRATRAEGVQIGSHYVPPNTSVRINTWSMQRDPRNFSPSPESFWPERWLIAEDPSTYKGSTPFVHNVSAFIPFSYGPANCVGKGLAWKEMKMVLCHLTQQVEVRFAEGYVVSEYERDMKDWFAVHVSRLPVVVTPRSANA
ncbi:hypothetical protein EUX98_g2944 [Antrodiella citrinella]|uniref:Cytochrome P450 n=1 Tax=Antrodiella citrinella TaxID=2447956 RepID=A0A4S4N0H2_9APHY|nr:hypothetical protein EUX98_g2944 [Antrodiella citrinella]